ncbi:MAG: tRNA (adenosine(37)-N6)-dimethylallyltransferase MiaA, partial [Planctomycetota bacterium]
MDAASSADPITVYPSLIDDVIVLTGATASGKSRVAIELAERIGAEIVSLDSIAVYREMDIGTAKASVDDQQRVSHHLINVADPSEEFSVAQYMRLAHDVTRRLRNAGRPVIFVGGTPMFLKGILRGFDPGPPADWEFRQQVEADVEAFGVEALRQRLRQVDPLAAHRIDPGDVRRMTRALEYAR